MNAKRPLFEQLLEAGIVQVHLDPRIEGVDVPVHLREGPHLALNFSHNYGLEVFEITDDAIRADLRFSGVRHLCTIPWHAVFLIGSQDAEAYIFPDALPAELAAEYAEAFQRAAPAAPALQLVGTDGVAPAAPVRKAGLLEAANPIEYVLTTPFGDMVENAVEWAGAIGLSTGPEEAPTASIRLYTDYADELPQILDKLNIIAARIDATAADTLVGLRDKIDTQSVTLVMSPGLAVVVVRHANTAEDAVRVAATILALGRYEDERADAEHAAALPANVVAFPGAHRAPDAHYNCDGGRTCDGACLGNSEDA